MYFAKQMNLATFATTVLTANTKKIYNNEKDNKVYTSNDGTATSTMRMQPRG